MMRVVANIFAVKSNKYCILWVCVCVCACVRACI